MNECSGWLQGEARVGFAMKEEQPPGSGEEAGAGHVVGRGLEDRVF